MSVDGAGTSVTADDGLLIGQYGDGTLSVSNGATFTIDTNQSDPLGYCFVGSADTANGTLIVSGGAVFDDNSDSGGHSLLCGDTLVLAHALVNGFTIFHEPVPEDAASAAPVDYFQIDFLEHDCIVAEGIFAETFADGPGLRRQFHNAAEFTALYPHHPAPEALRLVAPRPERGPALAAAIAPIAARAGHGVVPGPLEGFVDLVRTDLIEGWALDTHNPLLPVALELFANDDMIGTALATGAAPFPSCRHLPWIIPWR